ncbi:MAG: hypothetical protein HY830_20565 [Actinobacteria bacterium]|nr:hypothetical protein [Actinomycetota bacterium]
MNEAVVARLRDGAHDVPPARVDPGAVLDSARRALRRRRRLQSCAAVAVVLLAGTLTGPVHLPGIGTVAVPGSATVRRIAGLGGDAPGPAATARETARLERAVLPVAQELQATWFERSSCSILVYRRGVFSASGTCTGRPGERRFDSTARTDFERLAEAVRRSGVPTDELADATYAPDGSVRTAVFLRAGGGIDQEDSYVYSPSAQPQVPRTALGPGTVTPAGTTGWWFVRTPGD